MRKSLHTMLCSTTLLSAVGMPASALLLIASSSATAQETGATVAAAATETTGADQASARGGSETNGADIVVTGSRVTRAGFEAPTPLTVLSADSLAQKSPASIPEGLVQLPQFQAGISGSQTRNTSNSNVRSGNYLNLRALGTQRVLVLHDGHRLTPTGSVGGTDANLIPQMLVDRVEIVTGGASAAYGSDAVSGVVNFVLNKRFDGVKVLMQSGISTRGDNGNYRVGVAGGISLADDRLHLIASAEHFHSNGIPHKYSRPGGDDLITVTGAGTAADPLRYVPNTHYSNVSFGGYIHNGPLAGRQFLPNGQTGPFVAGPPTGRANLSIGGDGAYFDPSLSLLSEIDTYQTYGRASFDVSDNLTLFAEGSYNLGQNADRPVPDAKFGFTVFRDNAYLNQNLSAAELTQLGNTPSFSISRFFNEWGVGLLKQRADSVDARVGLEGKFGDGKFRYDLSYSYGHSNFRGTSNEVENRLFYAAADAVRNSAGQIVCRITITNPGLLDNCVPLNVMGVGTASKQAIDYVHSLAVLEAVNKQRVVSANISGEPFSTWAGPVSIAIGGEYRKQSLNQTSNSNPLIPIDFTGIRGVPSGTLKYFFNNLGVGGGSYNIKEAYAETVIPLAKDSFIGQSLELNGAVRLTDYSTSGTVTTWKVGATYQPIEAIRFRGTVSRDIRAPTLFELYAKQSSRSFGLSDPLTNTFGNVQVITGGNPHLKPEVAKTYTFGVVLKPPFIEGLTASVDYYNIQINDAIGSPFTSAFQLIDICRANPTFVFCSAIDRPLGQTDTSPANFPTSVTLNSINAAKFKTEGLDFEVSYRHALGIGAIGVRALATRLLTFASTPSPVSQTFNYVGNADFQDNGANPYPLPKWRGNLEVNYTSSGLGLSIQERYLGGFNRSEILVYAHKRVKPYFYTDATVTYDVKDWAGVQFFLTVNNLFDRKPPLFTVSNSPGLALPTLRSAYDIIGRQFTFGMRMKF